MATQNLISTGVPAVFQVGTKTFNFKITAANNADSWGRIDPNVNGLIAPNTNASTDVTNTLVITPAMSDNKTIQRFKEFWNKNPFYIRRLNIVASNSAYLPNNFRVMTPNIFTGNVEPQNIDVGANVIATNYQESIVTLETSIVVGRNSWIEIDGLAAPGEWLAIYMTLSVFASLEEGLYSFVSNDNSIE